MRPPTKKQIDDWKVELREHTTRGGGCPVCEVPHRCWIWAEAFGQLVTHDELPPETTPSTPAGGNPDRRPD